MLTGIALFLITFYAGAVLATAWSWLCVWRGAVRFAALRDLTGINDPVALKRHFGRSRADGSYQVTFSEVFRHRRAAGIVLTDLPLHLTFTVLLAWAAFDADSPAGMAIILAASAHALTVSGAALIIFAGSRRALLR